MNMDKKWVQKECKKYYKQGLEEGKEENRELQDRLDRIRKDSKDLLTLNCQHKPTDEEESKGAYCNSCYARAVGKRIKAILEEAIK